MLGVTTAALTAVAGVVPLVLADTESKQRLLKTVLNLPFFACILLSLLGYSLVVRIIPAFAPKFVDAGLFGIDLSKRTTARNADGSLIRPVQGIKVPEAVGVIPGVVYCFCVTFFLPFAFLSAFSSSNPTSGTTNGFTNGAAGTSNYAISAGDYYTNSLTRWLFSFFQVGQEGLIEQELEKASPNNLIAAGGDQGNNVGADLFSGSSFIPGTTASSIGSAQIIAQKLQQDVDSFSRMVQFLAAILSICSMSFFGFVDNVLNLRWRDKLLLPTLASLPLLLVYFATLGTTSVLLPLPLRWIFSFDIIDLGPFFYLFLCMITIFSVNAINIYAGVNGLEAGQSLIIAISLILNNLIQLARLPEEFALGRERHLFSLYILLPFVAVTLGLLKFNWYPSRVFVGDTFCYFAGMTLAVAGIFGHYSKTLLLFLLPQILNFVYGLPQLFRLVECPRHRLPGFDPEKNVSVNSFATVRVEELSVAGRLVFSVYKTFRLCKIEEITVALEGSAASDNGNSYDAAASSSQQEDDFNANDNDDEDIHFVQQASKDSAARISRASNYSTTSLKQRPTTRSSLSEAEGAAMGRTSTSQALVASEQKKEYRISNLTLINFVLYVFGPMNEETLVIVLLIAQAMFSLLAFCLRYFVSTFLYTKVL
ncbi:unnamed protein product [Amoebophrya sp. A120]|nr:unnamed protein product [Amoebophrya sp. A120]|eukprot:GSA120T00010815001.1